MSGNFKILIHIISELNYIITKSHKKNFVLLFIVIVISAGFELLGVSAILPFVEAVISPDMVMSNPYVMKCALIFGVDNANHLLVLLGIGLILLYITKNAFMLYANYVQNDFSTRVRAELSIKLLRSYMSRPYTFFLDISTSEILRGCFNDITSVYCIIENICFILSQLLTILLIGIFLICMDPIITFSIFAFMMLLFWGMIYFFKPAVKKAGLDSMQLDTERNKILVQIAGGIKELFVMQRKDFLLKEYAQTNDRYRKAQRTYTVLSNSPDKIVEGVCISGIIAVICIRLITNSDEMATFIPRLAAFAVAAFRILPSISKLTNRVTGIIYNRPGMEKVYQNVWEANQYDMQMKQYIQAQEKTDIPSQNLRFQEKLVVGHVFWQYENQKKPVLKNVDITIHKGESIALIGISGAGKTTLADIILGLLRPNKGCVKMDGIDVYTIPVQWAHIVGYVPQSVYLLDDTIRNNVAFGMPSKAIEDPYIWEALEKAQIKEFIKNLPNGLDTIVGERGIKFSGGQRQRIAIARALYNKPEILVLDEATAALDNETEHAVMEAINVLYGKLTLIIVAHRLTTIRNCDKIYEIKDGTAIERKKEDIFKPDSSTP